jgi:hypothetical protein
MWTSTPLAISEDRRDDAIQLLRDRRAALVRRGQRALLRQLLSAGTATADDVRAAVALPPDIDPRCMGAVPGELADPGIIRADGYVRTARPVGHARPVVRWALADPTGALAWLIMHPEMPDAEAEQPTL